MTLDDLALSISMSARVTPTEVGVLFNYRVGIGTGGAISPTLPTDYDVIAARDVALVAGANSTIHLDDFHVDAGAAWTDADGVTVSIVTVYAIVCYVSVGTENTIFTVASALPGGNIAGVLYDADDFICHSNLTGLASAAIQLLITETGATDGGTVRVVAVGKSS